MREIAGNLFTYSIDQAKILRCITTNGILTKKFELVMGAGVALEAKKRYPELPKILGKLVQTGGNHVYLIENLNIASFPTKHHWCDSSDLDLIAQSCQELITQVAEWDYVVMPRVGTGMGRLTWDVVKPILYKYLEDDKFLILVQ
jgi:hypothetical protein